MNSADDLEFWQAHRAPEFDQHAVILRLHMGGNLAPHEVMALAQGKGDGLPREHKDALISELRRWTSPDGRAALIRLGGKPRWNTRYFDR